MTACIASYGCQVASVFALIVGWLALIWLVDIFARWFWRKWGER